ncbi:hypothetical protein C8R46DRAFT_1185981 [Mycena filopes]|nr:hypothetical protein C8R46DRAFT_1185981 [Mycena filopes]
MNQGVALLCIATFLACAFTTVLFSKSDPGLGWVVLELKPALAVIWSSLTLILAAAFIRHLHTPTEEAIVLPENTASSSGLPSASLRLSQFLLLALTLDAAFASYISFKNGVAWPANGLVCDSVAALSLYFAHGLANCLGVWMVLYASYRGVKFIRGPVPIAATDSELEEGRLEPKL